MKAGVLAILCAVPVLIAQTYPVTQGKTYKFEKIAEGVYYATGGFGSNNVVIVNDRDVLLVDDGTTPSAARAFLDDIKIITKKPVRYVVNTHFHYDHTDGNSIFGPEVQIIAHDYVRQAIEKFDILHNEPFRSSTRTFFFLPAIWRNCTPGSRRMLRRIIVPVSRSRSHRPA